MGAGMSRNKSRNLHEKIVLKTIWKTTAENNKNILECLEAQGIGKSKLQQDTSPYDS